MEQVSGEGVGMCEWKEKGIGEKKHVDGGRMNGWMEGRGNRWVEGRVTWERAWRRLCRWVDGMDKNRWRGEEIGGWNEEKTDEWKGVGARKGHRGKRAAGGWRGGRTWDGKTFDGKGVWGGGGQMARGEREELMEGRGTRLVDWRRKEGDEKREQ